MFNKKHFTTPCISYGLVCSHLENIWISQSYFIFGEVSAKTRHSSYTQTLQAICPKPMNRILILIIFASQIAFGQSKIQHEPERLFNKLDLGKSTAEFIKEHKIEKIIFLRNTFQIKKYEKIKN
jgi:hypothetical protein